MSERIKNQSLTPVDITKIRVKLREYNQHTFEIHEQADSMEALQAFFHMLHEKFEQGSPNLSNPCPCIAHTHFGLFKQIQEKCECGVLKETEEAIFAEHINVTDIFYNTDLKYKTEIILGNESLEELIKKSALFTQKSLVNLLEKNKLGQCQAAECERCGSKTRENQVFLANIPRVYILQLVWAQVSPSLIKILQFLKGLNDTLDLSEIYNTGRSTRHVLKGIIVHLQKHYVYLVKAKNGYWSIINDSFAKILFTGQWYDVVDFFLSWRAYPAGLLFEEDDAQQYIPPEMNNELWMNYEKQIYFNEIFPKLKKTRLEASQWVCFYCSQIWRKHETSCSFCGNAKITELTPWVCSECEFNNTEENLICDRCSKRRFYFALEDEYCTVTDRCGFKSFISPGVCLECDILDNCEVCELPVFKGQTAMCIECGQKVSSRYCECELFPIICCRFCSDKLWICPQCKKNNISMTNKCRHCSYKGEEEMKLCKNCRKVTKSEKCGMCIGLDRVECVNCGRSVQLPVLFICPICDGEIDEDYCKICDYDIDFDRFVCGKCRKLVKRCIACGIGVILDEDTKCSVCLSTIENFKWLDPINNFE